MLHGGDLAEAMERYGGSAEDWLDLSTGINPHAYPVPEDFEPQAWRALPSSLSLHRLVHAARKSYACPESFGIVAAPGTQALISQLPFILPEGPVTICGPTYSSHAHAFERAGRPAEQVSSPHALPDRAKIAVIVNPNNPDGRLVDVQSLLGIARELSGRGGALVLDEAFADVMPGASILPHVSDQNIVVLRSFGKFFGLAGLRLGFMAAPPPLASGMSARLDSWAVSGPALEVGRRALEDADWQKGMMHRLAEEMADLGLLLGEHGLTVFGGTPLFALAACRDAHALHHALAKGHIWTRVFDYAPTWIRIGLPANASQKSRLSEALAESVSSL